MDGYLPQRASYSTSLGVAFGWFVTVIMAIMLGTQTLPQQPREPDQCGLFQCLSTSTEITIWLAFATPVVAVLLVVAWLLLVGIRRIVGSPLVAGTIAAVGAVAVTLLVLSGLGYAA